MSSRTRGCSSPYSVPPAPPPSPQTMHSTNTGRGELIRDRCSVESLTAEESNACIGAGVTPQRDASGQGQDAYSPSVYGSQGLPSGRDDGTVPGNHPWGVFERPCHHRDHRTTTGGTVPPPPAPGYQNTVTTSQQLAAQTTAIHYHIDSAVNKITRTFNNGNDWTTDQVMKQADNMADVAERLETQLQRQNEVIAEMRQMMLQLRNEVVALRGREGFVEERLRAASQEEVASVRDDGVGGFARRPGPVSPAPSPVVSRPFPRDSRIVTAPLTHPPPLAGSGRPCWASSREAVSFIDPVSHPSNLRSVSYQSSQGGRNPHVGEEKGARGRSSSSTEMHQKPESSAGKQPGGFLRTVKSKTSLSGLNKRAENIPPVPSVSNAHKQGLAGSETPIPAPKTPRRRGMAAMGLFPFGRRREDAEAEPTSAFDF